MKIIEINSVAYGSTGNIIFNLYKEFTNLNIKLYLFVGHNKGINKNFIRIGNRLSNLSSIIMTYLGFDGSGAYFATKKLIKKIRKINPDVIHLHNIHGYYVNYKLLFEFLAHEYEGKIIWTLHDCWAFTGHCSHFDAVNCQKWQKKCCNCKLYNDYPKSFFDDSNRLYFSKKQPHVVHLHVVNENSGEINWNLDFQNYLRENKDARDAYANTKLSLIKENPDGFNKAVGWFSDYTTKKGEIILEIAKKAGFKDYRFVIISNYNEIQSYKKLMQINKIHFNENISHLCLYKGTEIVAAACVKFNQKNFTAIIQTIKGTNIKYENIIKEKIKEWVTFHDFKLTV